MISTILNDIEADLHLNGWINAHPRRVGSNKLCLGIAAARNCRDVEFWKVHALLLQAANIQTGKEWCDVAHYNDVSSRTFGDILGVLQIARQLEQVEKIKADAVLQREPVR